jgi:hypothetical protein
VEDPEPLLVVLCELFQPDLDLWHVLG